MPKLEIHQFPCLSDNFGVLIRDADEGVVASIDAPDARRSPPRSRPRAGGSRISSPPTTTPTTPTATWRSRPRPSAPSSARAARRPRFPGIDKQVGEGDTFTFGSHEVRVLDTPGHTAGHITYWIPSANVAFVGDTLFAIGCGRVIEGNAQMMWQSLQKLMALPKETAVYCGHEYTQANARFALTIEPENEALQKRAKEVDAAARRRQGDVADHDRPRARDQPVPAPARARDPAAPRHGRQARMADLRRDPRAQEPQLADVLLLDGPSSPVCPACGNLPGFLSTDGVLALAISCAITALPGRAESPLSSAVQRLARDLLTAAVKQPNRDGA